MANGILIIDKPQDWTSMVCAPGCAAAWATAVGHAGTLDPMATGVLPVFVGRATRAVEFASEGRRSIWPGCGWAWSPTPRTPPAQCWRRSPPQ